MASSEHIFKQKSDSSNLLRSKNEVFNQLYVCCVTENKTISVQIWDTKQIPKSQLAKTYILCVLKFSSIKRFRLKNNSAQHQED